MSDTDNAGVGARTMDEANTPMEISAILLSGTPASGKDTITKILSQLDRRFCHFRKHKISSGGKLDESYFLVSAEEFENRKKSGGFIQYHERYGRGYGVSVEEFLRVRKMGKIPIIHVGKYENLQAFRDYGLTDSAISVLLYADRKVTKDRLKLRHRENEEVEQRLVAYNEELQQLRERLSETGKLDFNLVIINNGNDSSLPAQKIIDKLRERPSDEEARASLDRIILCTNA